MRRIWQSDAGTGRALPRIPVGAVTVSQSDDFLGMPVLLHAPSAPPVVVVYDTSKAADGANLFRGTRPTTALTATHRFNTDEFVALVGQPMLMKSSWFPLAGS